MSLDSLREKIDLIDDKILELISHRVEFVKEVGEIKKESSASQSFIRAGREASMLRNLIKKSDGVLPPAAIATIWRMLISASLSIEQGMEIHTLSAADKRCFWLAREYFGAFLSMYSEENVEDLITKVANKPAAVGVLPLIDDSKTPWWVRPAAEANDIYVFARIPFIETKESQISPVLAIANTCPEVTGDDISLFAVTAGNSEDEILEIFLYQGVKADILSKATNAYLVEVKGFIQAGDAIINNIANKLDGDVVVRLMGSYAVPVVI